MLLEPPLQHSYRGTVVPGNLGVRLWRGAPSASIVDGMLTVGDIATGASIGYRLDGDSWELYSGKVKLIPADKVEVKAVRYGWKESDIVVAGPQAR